MCSFRLDSCLIIACYLVTYASSFSMDEMPSAPLLEACTTITATATDPAINWFCQGNGVRGCTNEHVICVPPTSTASKGLVIFLPGTYLQPADYSDIVAEFSYHGFHALGLFYPSAEGQNGCGVSRTSHPTDLNCTARERFKVLTGASNGGRTNVTQPDSIVNRAAKALAYLGAPWSTYLDSTKAVRWSDVIIAGHSNGADHAGFLAKNFNVSRALMFAGPNDNIGARLASNYFQPAPWVYGNWTSNVAGETATPPERLYGFGVCGYRTPLPPNPALTKTWQVFPNVTNIYDREPSPTNATHGTLKFVGIFNSVEEPNPNSDPDPDPDPPLTLTAT